MANTAQITKWPYHSDGDWTFRINHYLISFTIFGSLSHKITKTPNISITMQAIVGKCSQLCKPPTSKSTSQQETLRHSFRGHRSQEKWAFPSKHPLFCQSQNKSNNIQNLSPNPKRRSQETAVVRTMEPCYILSWKFSISLPGNLST